MAKANDPTHMFSTMLKARVDPVMAYENSGFFLRLERYMKKCAKKVDSYGGLQADFGNQAMVRMRVHKGGFNHVYHIAKGASSTVIEISLKDDQDEMRVRSSAVLVRDNRRIANANKGTVARPRITAAHFNGDGGEALKELEKAIYTKKPAVRPA